MIQVVVEHCFGEFRARMHRNFRYTSKITGSGVPLGRGSTPDDAMDDLARRARLDGGSLTVADMEVVKEDLKNCTCASDMASDSKLDDEGHLPDCRSR